VPDAPKALPVDAPNPPEPLAPKLNPLEIVGFVDVELNEKPELAGVAAAPPKRDAPVDAGCEGALPPNENPDEAGVDVEVPKPNPAPVDVAVFAPNADEPKEPEAPDEPNPNPLVSVEGAGVEGAPKAEVDPNPVEGVPKLLIVGAPNPVDGPPNAPPLCPAEAGVPNVDVAGAPPKTPPELGVVCCCPKPPKLPVEGADDAPNAD
jgi:hypothetical protein